MLFEKYIKTDTITFKHAKGKSVMSGKEFHIYNEIIYFIDGNAELITEQSHSDIKPYTFIVIPKETYHQVKITGDPNKYHRCIIHFSEPIITKLITLSADSEIKYLFSKLINNTESDDSKELLKAVLVLLINKINSEATIKSSSLSQNPFVLQIIDYINNNLSNSLSVTAIAKTFNISQSSLAHLFKREIGISIHRYITEKRLITAYGKINMGEAATTVHLSCGFKDYSNFYRQYKAFFGFPPSKK